MSLLTFQAKSDSKNIGPIIPAIAASFSENPVFGQEPGLHKYFHISCLIIGSHVVYGDD